jgi:nicotinamide-nucleotide amidase
MHAEIISIGDEITSGQLLDTNSQWLSQRLDELGVRVLFHCTVGDELEPNVAVFRQAIDRADLIVVTGGLGPTADDLTRQALADATGRPLQLDPEALEYIRAMFARRKRPMPQQNELQAMFPSGSRVICNPHGTAPGIDLTVAREGRTPCRLFCLPGVPAEMVEMWQQTVGPAIVEQLGSSRRMIRRRRIHCFGAGESQIESMLPDMIRRGRQPTVGITASKATITLRIVAEGATEDECLAAMEPTVATIRQCLGTLVFGEEDDDLQHVVLRLLSERGKTLATAECGTSGLVAEWLSGTEGAGDAYRGGLVLPNASESAEAMAILCRQQFATDLGLAITLSSPSGSVARTNELPSPSLSVARTNELPSPSGRGAGGEGGEPETVSFALASSDGVQQKRIPSGIHPALKHIYIAKHALNFVRLAIVDGL